MDHRSEVARPTTVDSTNLGMAGEVQGGEAHMSASTFHAQLGAAAARRASFEASAAAYHNSAEFVRHVRAAAGRAEVPAAVFHREPAPGVAYASIGEFWRQLGPVGVVLLAVGPQLHHNYGYSALQPTLPGAGRGVVLADLLPGGVGMVYSGDYALRPRPGAGHGEVLVDLLPDGAGVVYNHYTWQPYPGAGHGEVFVGLLPDGVFAQQTVPGTGRAGEIAGVLRDPNLSAVYDNRGMVAEHLRRLLPFAGIGVASLAVNGLAAGPGSPAVAFHLFVMLLGGLFLLILHVLHV